MKDNKLYKVLRIIFLTLAIISLVFTLCKKVGLCASSNPTEGQVFDSILPIPVGVGYGYDSTQIVFDDTFVQGAQAYCNSRLPYESTPDISVIYFSEDNYSSNGYYEFCAISQDGVSRPLSFTVYTSSGVPYAFEGPNTYLFRFRWYPDTNTYDNFYYIGYRVWTCYLFGSNNYPFGSAAINNKYAFNKDTFFTSYPIWVDRYDYTDSTGLYTMFQSISNSTGITFENGEVTSLPSFDTLPGNVTSTDDQQTLFDKLKGWLSTLSGNIQKGFKNIEENLTSFFKPYLDNIKGFFDWVTEPFDPEAASDSLEAIQAISDIRSLNNVIGTSGIFDWDDVLPASRVAFTFDFGGAVLPHHQYEINFDWYTGTVKTLILSILVTFLVVGLLVTIINNIPSMIHGHSGDSGGGSN